MTDVLASDIAGDKAPEKSSLLQIKDLRVNFGGVRAMDGAARHLASFTLSNIEDVHRTFGASATLRRVV